MNIINSLKNFFKERFNLYLVIFLIIAGVTGLIITDAQTTIDSEKTSIHFFYLPTCPHCAEQKPIIAELENEYPELNFYSHDASSQEGSKLFYQMAVDAGLDINNLAVPTTFIGKHALIGYHSKQQIIDAIDECISECKDNSTISEVKQENKGYEEFDLPFIGRTDLTTYSLPVLAITLGLIDGFNPCAMWVLVYLIGMLIGLNDKKKIWIIVGSFVLASGILYFLFMTAWINIFLLVGYIQILTIIIGLIALGGGILSLRDYVKTKGQMVCKVTGDDGRKKTMSKIDHIIMQPLSWAIVSSIIVLAFIVNSVEFVCSAAIPAVFTQILALNQLTALQNYLYIAIYVFFFMLDDLIIFSMAAFAVGSALGEKYAKYCKLIGGIIMTILGILMVFAPQLLR